MTVHFHGAIDRKGLEQDATISCSDMTTVGQLLYLIGYTASQTRWIVPMLDGERCPLSRGLRQGDRLDVLAP
ncbi:MAG: hypothetical protein MUF54_16295, partial [Polyangiaceae bacterium]|nr:hypothetical protein [Polyangiaceae bacterium]